MQEVTRISNGTELTGQSKCSVLIDSKKTDKKIDCCDNIVALLLFTFRKRFIIRTGLLLEYIRCLYRPMYPVWEPGRYQ